MPKRSLLFSRLDSEITLDKGNLLLFGITVPGDQVTGVPGQLDILNVSLFRLLAQVSIC
jgi:hypothetical protein